MRSRLTTLAVAALALAAPAAAQEGYRHGRIRYVEGGTLLQRATEPGTEEALPNFPFLPGDRIWTTESGRAEFQFPPLRLVRLDVRSKLDYVAHEDGEDERNVLRLWSGAAFVHQLSDEATAGLEIETPGGLVVVRERAVLRIDVAQGETRLSVYAGSAVLDSGRERRTVEAGERSAAHLGEVERPQEFDTRETDAFARWNGEREARESYVAEAAPELPEEVAPYAAELEPYGSWHVEVGVGDVWVPSVGTGWAPYVNGRWTWTPYGWTWVPYDPWGWAPFHYGNWGLSASLGWYWAPGSSWGPAWVSWSVGGGYVGWCPIGPHGRPAEPHPRGRGDYAVPRGSAGHRSGGEYAVPRGSVGPRSGWVYAREGDLAARDVARRRVSLGGPEASRLRVIETPEQGHIDRSLRVVEGRAAPRHVSTRPTPGDTVDELRTDPATTIPFPTARRRYPSELERQREAEANRSSRTRFSREDPASTANEPRSVRRREGVRPAADAPQVTTGQVTRRAPAGWSSPERSPFSGASTTRSRGVSSQGSESGAAARSRERDRAENPERQILRRMFGSLGEGRSGSSASGRSSGSDRDSGRSASRPPDSRSSGSGRNGGGTSVRSQPERRDSPARVQQSRPAAPRSQGNQGAAGRRKKES